MTPIGRNYLLELPMSLPTTNQDFMSGVQMLIGLLKALNPIYMAYFSHFLLSQYQNSRQNFRIHLILESKQKQVKF